MRGNRVRRIPNPVKGARRALEHSVTKSMIATGDMIVALARDGLRRKHGDSPLYTGALEDSIHRSEVYGSKTTAEMDCYADATNPYNGAMYAQFLEEGTGDQGSGTGERKWRYKGKMRTYVDPETGKSVDSEWYTTSGMKADPFLKPATETALEFLQSQIKSNVIHSFGVNWYNGSLQLWNENDDSKPSPGGGIRTDI